MNLTKILKELGLEEVLGAKEIAEGEDSSVWQIELEDGKKYALRILPIQSLEQFIYEHKMIELAREHDIPVPKVYEVKEIGEYAVMLMEWANGMPLLHALMEYPDRAMMLGREFGKVQAEINLIELPLMDAAHTKGWFAPKTDREKNLLNKLQVQADKAAFLHLDYHPLNVLTDGYKITAVIDWSNASVGDARFDFARTFSILELERPDNLPKEMYGVIQRFEDGWKEGYQQVSGELKDIPLYYTWAGYRMGRDLSGRRTEENLQKIYEWADGWQKK